MRLIVKESMLVLKCMSHLNYVFWTVRVFNPMKDEAQTVLFKDPVRTAQ